MKTRIQIQPILTHVYALTAMATLAEKCTSPLLHPDHEDALRHTVRDALAIILCHAPKGTVALKGLYDDYYELEFNEALDQNLCAEAFRAAIAHYTVALIRGAAGLDASPLPSLDFLSLPEPDGPQASKTVYTPGRIDPCRY